MKNLALVGGTGFIGQSISEKVNSNILVVSRKTEGQLSKNPIILFDNFCHDYSNNQDYIFYIQPYSSLMGSLYWKQWDLLILL